MMNETWGRIHFFITLLGTYAIFMPMHYLGIAGYGFRSLEQGHRMEFEETRP